ncbi:MAG TPA: glycerophosphodiester phosphodiesterase family protein, partial [Ktedonobacterales bacterium]|nr:glycerophosphodiester phosphodiesterase family protein [Ktedonobacterales bacterium]
MTLATNQRDATGREQRAAGVTPPSPICYAHRGARGHAPENTLLAFDLAFDLGADGIECDAQLSADGRLVIIHDGTVNRTTSGRGAVSALGYDALRLLDAGRGQRIPSLDETLALVRARDGLLNLELKAESGPEALAVAEAVAARLAALADDDSLRQRIIVSSFSLPAVGEIKRRLPWLRVGALYGGRAWRRQAMIERALALGVEAIHPHPRILTQETVRAAHEAGLRVNVWTANRWATIRQLIAWEVDSIFSDFPERVVIARRVRLTPEEQ